ncbi:MAG: hypothetical protein HQL21_07500 [Candidatus Omnitrophica bacterium]|nr:hypothetical protein [Candidatus Omnitrophota bacterium]
MRIVQFLKVMGVVTFMAVLYIHLQMRIYDLGYQGQAKAQKIEKLAESNSLVKNDILRLKSSSHIGHELLTKDDHYRFASRKNVVEVEAMSHSWPETFAAKTGVSRIGRFLTLAFAPADGRIGK